MTEAYDITSGQRARALWLSTVAMAVCFAVWVIFSIIGVELQRELGFSQTAFGLLVATPILTGSVSRILLGIWSELYGARRVYTVLMLVVAACAFVLPHANSYPMLLAIGLGLGLAGGSFAVGVVYVTCWYPRERHGTALGLFGMGNAGASLTSFGAPLLLAVMDWRQAATVYGAGMLAMALVFWFASQEDPVTLARRTAGAPVPSIAERLAPLRNLQVWRFSLYYFLVFGGFIALTSWLPRYYVGAHDLDIRSAGMLTASFAFPAAVFRALGGVLADRYGARTMMYVAFSVSLACLFLLSYPDTHYVVRGIRGPIEFTIAPGVGQRMAVLFVLGFVMALGMAAVFKPHSHLLPEPRRQRRRRGGDDRRSRRVLPADRLRLDERPDRRVDRLLHAAVRHRRHQPAVDALRDPPHGAAPLPADRHRDRPAGDDGRRRGRSRRRRGAAPGAHLMRSLRARHNTHGARRRRACAHPAWSPR
ncbi:MAG: MFS transporter [Burkholderiales bacterium]|nr:MFS transporter [Burkholderiales bacterium]